ncbi:sulfite exporter TauE/SafE family protein [Planctomycetota bacterium]
MFDPWYILAFTITFCSMFIESIGGFGGGIFAMSLLVLFLPLPLSAVAYAFASTTGLLYLVWKLRHNFPLKQVLSVVAGRIAGVSLGVYLLSLALHIYAKLLLTGVIVFIALKEIIVPDKARTDLPQEIRINTYVGLGLGFLSGILNGWINMGGPPLILYAYRSFEGRSARRFLIACFFLSFPFKVIMYYARDLITVQSWVLFCYLVPGTILGTWIGHRFQNRMNRELFVRVAWFILLGLGIILGGNTLLSFLKP